jgi:hypothetical protein
MGPKFKAGDRVVTVISEDTLLLRSGMTGTVVNYYKSILEGCPFVKILFDNNTIGEYHDYRFELIEETEITA